MNGNGHNGNGRKIRATTRKAVGVRRKGGGRPPTLATQLKRLYIEQKQEEAEKAFAFCCDLFADGKAPPKVRFEAAREIMNRVWGRTPQTVHLHDWRSEIVELLRAGKLTPEQVRAELGDDLATELFVAAGVPVAQGRTADTPSER